MFGASARHRYLQHVKDQKQQSIQESRKLKRKAVDEEIECLRKKKAKSQRDITLIVKSNSLRKSPDEKRNQKGNIEKNRPRRRRR